MTHFLSKYRAIVLLILIQLLVSVACQTPTNESPTDTPEPGGTNVEVVTSSPTQVPETPEIRSSPTNEPEPEVIPSSTPEPGVISASGNVDFGPGPFNLATLSAGLSELSSYKATLSLSFDGTQAGQPSQWSQVYVMLNSIEPLGRQVTIEQSGQVSDPVPVFMAEANGVAYEQRGDQVCTASLIAPGDSLAEQMELAGFLTGVIGAEEAGSETINGVAANYYTFDERAIGQLGVAESTGELWVAADGGYVVRYVLTTTGGADYFGEGSEGTATWDYELTDANQPVIIELPAGCPAGLVDAPLLPDAVDILNEPGLLSYTTLTSMAEAAVFYQEQLPTLGWQQTADPIVGETVIVLDFTQADQLLSLIITNEEGVTTVNIVVGINQ